MEIGAIDIRESYTIFEIDSQVEKDLIKKVSKVDFDGVDLIIKASKEKAERKFQREKKNKSSFNKGKKRRGNFDNSYKGNSGRKNKNRGRYNN